MSPDPLDPIPDASVSEFLFFAYGLRIASNRRVPGFQCDSADRPADLRLCFGKAPCRDAIDAVANVEPALRPGAPHIAHVLDGAYRSIRYLDGVSFLIDREGTTVWVDWLAPMTFEDALAYLLGPVLGLVLRGRGLLCLHASAVAVDDRAIALLGPSGGGKSTAAAMLLRMGFPVLCDDVLVVENRDGQFWVRPSYPMLRLWPDAAKALLNHRTRLEPLTPNWAKQGLPLRRERNEFINKPLPLATIYTRCELDRPRVPVVSNSTRRDAFFTMLANTYPNPGYALDGRIRAREFQIVHELSRSVPLRILDYRRELAGLRTLCAQIIDDARRLMLAEPSVA